ncbi:hypothetical protein C7S18_16805 [Ahniella affigens]|uniref:Uncharacterized protein n=1 Tax=Ahniella affigens TaxID=2021234 RepID=A0A2P1PV53_9GAMM|nr:tetratricopeptide repeat protein [Ahniella affigens]AVP98745.1 hypothetical protein C7S18_16805 [Ahniella affigens]
MNTRTRAAAAMTALANRYETAGKKPVELVGGPDWVAMPGCPGMMMHRGHLSAALDYYDFAAMIDPDDLGHRFSKALVLESLGDWHRAIAAFQGLFGSVYDDAARAAIERCGVKADGRVPSQLSRASLVRVVEWEDHDATSETGSVISSLARARARRQHARAAMPMRAETDAEQAAAVASSFVHLLLDRQWSAAHAMLAPGHCAPGPEHLREAFERLFGAEVFPVSADVFEVQTDMEQLSDADLGWVHVAIPSRQAEAVSLVVTRHTSGLKVRDVAIGSP